MLLITFSKFLQGRACYCFWPWTTLVTRPIVTKSFLSHFSVLQVAWNGFAKKLVPAFLPVVWEQMLQKILTLVFLDNFLERPPPIRLFDSSSCGLARSCEKLKSLSLLLKSLWPRKLVGWWLTLNGFYPWPFTHDPLVTWSCEITWQTETVIYSLPHCLLPPNLPGWRLTLRGSNHKVTWPLIRLSS